MSSIQLSNLRSDVVLMTIDMPDKSANVLTDQMFADLDAALCELEANPPQGLILFSAKPSIFVAGADLVNISQTLDWSDQRIVEFCQHGRAIMQRINLLPSYSVAAIHGVCVGGGLELALWCDQRIVSDHGRTLLGLPETKLGLVPGWAGTVRLPRLIGLQPAIELTTSASLINAKTCCKLGLAAQSVPQDELLECSLIAIDKALESQDFLQTRRQLHGSVGKVPADLAQLEKETLAQIEGNLAIGHFAAKVVLEHMLRTRNSELEEACRSEAIAMTQVYGSPDNIGLLHYFFLEERAKKTRARFDKNDSPSPKTIGLVGAGLMGQRIAQLSIRAGYDLVVYDADPRVSERLLQNVAASASQDGSAACVDSSLAKRIKIADSLGEFRGADIVIESVVEKLVVKQKLLRELEQILADDTFIFSNTSTLPIGDLATALQHPQRFAGLHFCCPVEPLRLVEIIRGAVSSDLVMNVALDFTKRIRKTPVVVNDCCGFVVNRLLCPMFDQAVVMLQHGISAEHIDRIFVDFGFAAGPLEMIDFIGVDTIMYAGDTLMRAYPDQVTLTPILPALVKRGRLGRKTQRGFYQYDTNVAESENDLPINPTDLSDASRSPTRHGHAIGVSDQELLEVLESYQKEPWQLTDHEILQKLLSPMIAAGRKLLVDGIIEDAREIDLCSVLGATFPKEKGGLLFWADQGGDAIEHA